MKPVQQLLTTVLTVALLGGASIAEPVTYAVGDPNGKDVVTFTSDAPVELIKGQTSRIRGKITFDDSFKFDAEHPFSIAFNVDLASLDTGIPLRNQHMRDNFLETGRFPKATFRATSVKLDKKPDLSRVGTINIKATGDFTVHGVTVKKTIPVKVTYIPEGDLSKKRVPSGNLIRIQSTFPVDLAEHNIQRPEVLFVKLADTVQVSIDTIGTNGSF